MKYEEFTRSIDQPEAFGRNRMKLNIVNGNDFKTKMDIHFKDAN
jgi:hypothetical protein